MAQDDVERALAALELEVSDAAADDASQAPPADPNPPDMALPQKPPPLLRRPRRKPGSEVPIRAQFDNLFTYDARPAASARVGDRMAAMRAQVEAAEQQIARFREAWTTREKELERLDRLLRHERSRAERGEEREASAEIQLEKLQEFLQQKKADLQAYGHQAEEVFAQQQRLEKDLREQLAQHKQEADAEARRVQERSEEANQQAEALRAELDKLRAQHTSAQRKLAAQDQELETLTSEVAESSEQAERRARKSDEHSQVAISKRDAKIRKLAAALHQTKVRLQDAEEALLEKEEALARIDAKRRSAYEDLATSWESLNQARHDAKRAEDDAERLKATLAEVQRELGEVRLATRASGAALGDDDLGKLVRALLVASRLVDRLVQVVAEVQVDILDAGLDMDTEDLDEIVPRLRKSLQIARNLVGGV